MITKHTINTYMRSIRVFWAWLVQEEIIDTNLFSKLKIPKPPRKVMATFSPYQTGSLLSVMNASAEGYRDAVIVLTLLDTGLRVNELINLMMDNIWLEEGLIKVLGKRAKKRRLPIGKRLLAALWKYQLYRPQSATEQSTISFLPRMAGH